MRCWLFPLIALVAACSSSESPDASAVPTDAAALPTDARVPSDAGVTARDATLAEDAEPGDVSGGNDGGGLCGPVPRIAGRARLSDAIAAWIGRCNPELSEGEARVLALDVSAPTARAFDTAANAYDPARAGECGCAIEAASCDSFSLLRDLPACDAMIVASATTSVRCLSDLDCPTRAYCRGAFRTLDAFGAPTPDCEGSCAPIFALGEPCTQRNGRCAPGLTCDLRAAPAVCVAKARVGESCDRVPCVGTFEDVLLFPTNDCELSGGAPLCVARGRSGGARCEFTPCHELYTCLSDGTCAPRPGDGDRCATPWDVEVPNVDQRAQLTTEAERSCRVPAAGVRGYWCTQTGTTTGDARCLALPALGEACGIGPGLAAACMNGAYCPGIDEETFAPVMSVCIASLPERTTCKPTFISANEPCERGQSCLPLTPTDARCEPACSD